MTEHTDPRHRSYRVRDRIAAAAANRPPVDNQGRPVLDAQGRLAGPQSRFVHGPTGLLERIDYANDGAA